MVEIERETKAGSRSNESRNITESCESWLQNIYSMGTRCWSCIFSALSTWKHILVRAIKLRHVDWWKPSFAKVKAREDSYSPLPAFSELVLVGWMTSPRVSQPFCSARVAPWHLFSTLQIKVRNHQCGHRFKWSSDPVKCFHFMTFQVLSDMYLIVCILKSSKHEPLAVARFVLQGWKELQRNQIRNKRKREKSQLASRFSFLLTSQGCCFG